jgi:anti-sigma regulatory factor (Ser/Thr protein kinase)
MDGDASPYGRAMRDGRPMTASLVHEALFYRDADELAAATTPFISSAIADGEPVLVAAPGPTIDAVAGALGEAALRVRFMDMTRAGRNPGKIIPWVLYAFLDEHPGRPVHIIGEPVWAGRSATEYPACVQHEALVNVAFAGRAVRLLCPYHALLLRSDVLGDATRTHPVLVEGDERKDSPDYTDPDAVVAEFNLPLPEPPADALALDFDASTLGSVRDFVAAYGWRAGLSDGRLGDLELAANELATNAVTHGGGAGRLLLWRAAHQVVCEVRDRGRAVGRLIGRTPPGPDSLDGRGLVLVNYVSDLVRVRTAPTGTAVRLYLDL